MILALVALAVSFVAGFGVGRIKNAGKLAAAKAELVSLEGKVAAEVAKVIAAVRAKL
jgi:hypothetical protein